MKIRSLLPLVSGLLLFGFAHAAIAQPAQPVIPLQGGTAVGPANPMYIQGALTATLGGFTPSSSGARMTPLTVTTSDSSGTLPTGNVVVVANTGTTNPMYCNVNGVAATTSDQLITANGGWFSFTIPATVTTLHCIATGGSTTANGVGGSGLATGTGGGSGGGSGGNVNVTQWDTTALGVPTAYGTAPTTGNYIGVNAAMFGYNGSAQNQLQLDSSNNLKVVGVGLGVGGTPVSGTTMSGTGCQVTTAELSGLTNVFWYPFNCDNTGRVRATLASAGPVAPGTAAAKSNLSGSVYTSAGVTLTDGQQAATQIDAKGGLLIGGAGYPAGATPIAASNTGTISATSLTLSTGASVTTYICGYSIRANATAAATGNATVTGTISSMNFTQWTAPNASGLGINEQIFVPCIPASAANTGIVVTSAAPGTGGVVSVTAWGFTR